MKKALILSLLVGVAAAAPAQQAQPAPAAPARQMDMGKFKMAVTDARRKLFAAGMSNLTPQQLETFWGVYADYEKEKDAITSARMELLRRYVEGFSTLTDTDITKMVGEAAATQKANVDLGMKYFGIYSQKINAQVAGRFFLIDDYITTALRLQLLDQLPLLGDAQKR
jgi:hypothetical protein